MHVRHKENKVDIHTVRYEKARQSCMPKKSRDEICNRDPCNLQRHTQYTTIYLYC